MKDIYYALIKKKDFPPHNISFYLLIAILLIIIDQAIKYYLWFLSKAEYSSSFFSLSMNLNYGISFGLLNSYTIIMHCLVLILHIGALTSVCFYFYRNYHLGIYVLPETLICAGGISNLIDRFLYHGVIDYFILKFFSIVDFPFVGNFADIVVVIGCILLFFTKRD